ncbi:hypothetical protein IMZ48_43135, partial [Candidatus Bathyarchaeota archaeon]|nr:hypothetical protein [Candidatus Bathyarchaeota archaeon]
MSSSLGHKILANARKLVPFLPPKPISPLTAKDQDALLLSRLPLELRELIWERCFYGYAVHVVPSRGKVHARVCREWDDGLRGPHFDSCGHKKRIECDFISLLLTCKKMYVACPICSRPTANHLISYFECIHPLYRRTSFDFSHCPTALPLMPKRLPASHLALVSQVNLKWEIFRPFYLKSKKLHENAIFWLEMWKALAAMGGLEWLSVELRIVSGAGDAEVWTELE